MADCQIGRRYEHGFCVRERTEAVLKSPVPLMKNSTSPYPKLLTAEMTYSLRFSDTLH